MTPGNFVKNKSKEIPVEPKNLKEAIPAEDQSKFKSNMANFYDVNPSMTKDTDLQNMPL